MIIHSKNQASKSKYNGFYNSVDAFVTKIKMSITRKLELLFDSICKDVGRSAKDFLIFLNQVLFKNQSKQMSRAFIAQKLSMSTRTVTRILAILESVGYIKVIRYKLYDGMNGTNVYSLTTFFWETMERLDFQKALKPNNGSRDIVSKITITPPLPSKERLINVQKTVDNSPIFDDIPIPDF